MTPFDLGYIAGIIDGEGSITLSTKSGQRPKLRISVGSTSFELLQYLESHMGGSAHQNRAWVICDPNCKEPHVHSRKQRYAWHINGERAWIVLHNLAEHLICKHDEATEALTHYTPITKYNLGRILKIAEEMMEKGWDIACVR